MALTAIITKILAPAISIKHPEAFQVAATLPIPQPSTLVGALGYCMGTFYGTGLTAGEEAKKITEVARSKALTEVIVTSSVTLKRFRVLDKGFEKGEYSEAYEVLHQGNLSEFKRMIESGLTDALYREYISQTVLKCVWIAKKPIDPRVLRILQRLGDTESLVTVLESWSANCFSEEVTDISTDYPFTVSENNRVEVHGDHVLVKMKDEAEVSKMFYIPCRREIAIAKDGSKYLAYKPRKVDLKFSKPVKIFNVEEENIVMG